MTPVQEPPAVRDLEITFDALGETHQGEADGTPSLWRCDVTWRHSSGEMLDESRCTSLADTEDETVLDVFRARLRGRILDGTGVRSALEQATWWTAEELRRWQRSGRTGPTFAQFEVKLTPGRAWTEPLGLLLDLRSTVCAGKDSVMTVRTIDPDTYLLRIDAPGGTHAQAREVIRQAMLLARHEDHPGDVRVTDCRVAAAVTASVKDASGHRSRTFYFPTDNLRTGQVDGEGNAEFDRADQVLEVEAESKLEGSGATWTVGLPQPVMMQEGTGLSSMDEVTRFFQPRYRNSEACGTVGP